MAKLYNKDNKGRKEPPEFHMKNVRTQVLRLCNAVTEATAMFMNNNEVAMVPALSVLQISLLQQDVHFMYVTPYPLKRQP